MKRQFIEIPGHGHCFILSHKFTIDFGAEKLGMPHQMRFGAYSLYSKKPNNKNLKSKINKALAGNKAMICELKLDHNQEQMPKAINKRIGKKSVPTKLEDMYPFLSKEELNSNNYKN